MADSTTKMAPDARWARRLNPFTTPETRRLGVLFAVVYFSQGMWYLPNQAITMSLKDRGLSAGQVADFFLITTMPWLLKPVYGLVSDFVPLFGRRRKSYFLLTTALPPARASSSPACALIPTGHGDPVTPMGFGLAFTDVLTDALMVENGRPLGLTGSFQSVQWAAIYTASILVGVLGGLLRRAAALIWPSPAAVFPVVSFVMALLFVREAPARADAAALRETGRRSARGLATARCGSWPASSSSSFSARPSAPPCSTTRPTSSASASTSSGCSPPSARWAPSRAR